MIRASPRGRSAFIVCWVTFFVFIVAVGTWSPGALASPRIASINGRAADSREVLDAHVGDEVYVTFAEEVPSAPVLVLAGYPLQGGSSRAAHNAPRTIVFALERKEEDSTAWRHILGPVTSPRVVSVDVGFLSQGAVLYGDTSPTLRLHMRSSRQAVGWTAVLLILYGVVAAVGIRGGMLLDAGPGTSLSLGRCQMFLWTTLVVFGFLLIWLVTGDADTVTSQCLVLMGISSATALGAKVVASGRDATQQAKLVATGMPTVQAAIQVRATYQSGASYFGDILQDDDGIFSLHRMQIVVWTLVLAVIFGIDVWRELAMPQFSDTLLALMGLSGGTYLGFKLQENPASLASLAPAQPTPLASLPPAVPPPIAPPAPTPMPPEGPTA